MPRSEVMAHIRQKKNLESVNVNAAKKEMEKLQSRLEELKKIISRGEATLDEYDKIISAIQQAGEV